MSVQILEDYEHGYKVLYCTSTMTPFGHIMYKDDDVEHFLEWLTLDARKYTPKELSTLYYTWQRGVEDGEID